MDPLVQRPDTQGRLDLAGLNLGPIQDIRSESESGLRSELGLGLGLELGGDLGAIPHHPGVKHALQRRCKHLIRLLGGHLLLQVIGLLFS